MRPHLTPPQVTAIPKSSNGAHVNHVVGGLMDSINAAVAKCIQEAATVGDLEKRNNQISKEIQLAAVRRGNHW